MLIIIQEEPLVKMPAPSLNLKMDVLLLPSRRFGELVDCTGLKTGVPQGTGGSNPSASAKKVSTMWALFFCLAMGSRQVV